MSSHQRSESRPETPGARARRPPTPGADERGTRRPHPGCDELQLLRDAQATLARLVPGLTEPAAPPGPEEHEILQEVAARLFDCAPYAHPLYAGQMMKPPHRVARLAAALAMWLNPNNHSAEGGRASGLMEQEAVAELAAMFGWEAHLGHLCSGGTVANLEALWIADRTRPGGAVIASEQAHYTHRRASELLKLDFHSVAVDRRGCMDVSALRRLLASGCQGTVVATLGSTALGALDPLPEILALRERYDFRLHVDAAYGGYFSLVADLAPRTRAIFAALAQVDSLVVDPHKHGLQPYGCSCLLLRDPSLAPLYRHPAPYAHATDPAPHPGEFTLECSRSGATAVALWATQRLLPLTRGGRFSLALAESLRAAGALDARLRADERFLTLDEPQLDIVVWAPRATLASEISTASRTLLQRALARGLHLSLVDLPAGLLRAHWPQVEFDARHVTCLRSCLVKPEHARWLERIWATLDAAWRAPLA